MVFLVPILLIIAVIFGIDYVYFKNENTKIEQKLPNKTDTNLTQKQEFVKKLFETK